MRKRFLTVVLLFFSVLNSFSQGIDTFQSDSIYRVNKVKSRIQVNVGALTKETNILKYDKEGRLSEDILTNESGIRPQKKIVYKYDLNGRLIAEDYFYGSIEGEKTKIEYDESGRLMKKPSTYYDNKLKCEIRITYNPLVEYEKHYTSDGKLRGEYYSYYERRNVTIKLTAIDFKPSGQKERSWEYWYSNTFDKSGQVLKRETKQGKQVIQAMEYEYNAQGLLIRKKIEVPLAQVTIVEEYKYEFWH